MARETKKIGSERNPSSDLGEFELGRKEMAGKRKERCLAKEGSDIYSH